MPNSFLVSELASQPVVTVLLEDTLEQAYQRLLEHEISAVLVVGRDGLAAGVLSRRDLLEIGRVTARIQNRPSGLELPVRSCGDVMSHPVVGVPPQTTVAEAAKLMVARRVHRVFVLERGGEPWGVFSTRDAMAAVRAIRIATPISEIASTRVATIPISHSLIQGLNALERVDVGGVFVVDDALPVGVFGQAEALAARGLPPSTPIEEVMEPSLVLLPGRTPLYRAASFSMSTAARRIGVVSEHHLIAGIVTGMDFCRALAVSGPEPLQGVAARG
jgi:CBS domain-containing protein